MNELEMSVLCFIVAHYHCSDNMDHLLETTHLKHYELYRSGRLGEMGFPNGHGLVPFDNKSNCKRSKGYLFMFAIAMENNFILAVLSGCCRCGMHK